ncbi:hypothetical protein HHL11_30970 [Ramlibacter sp. G-1-2-2]|uniref:Uncharacterized protein n=1 Tax=Ramlibacter agri TaxID=2728837 RepID=A0A848HFU9_9BURK|nr:hypothetical protein [Ramlibacter agri]NML48211.1 hypothetical protein [Ramlibacter agri]
MRWLRSSIHSIFSVRTSVSEAPPEGHHHSPDDVREAMLALAGLTTDDRAASLIRRIRYAADLEALWYMRGELMHMLARSHGEVIAREKLEDLSELFTDFLPRGLRSRPSPLNGSYRPSRPPGSDEG